MLCQFQVYSIVNQLYIYIYPLCFRFFSHIGHYRVLSRVPCAIQQVLISYLFYIQQCVCVNLKCKLVQPLWRTVWSFLKKLSIELPYDPAIPLLGIYPKKTIIRKGTCTPVFIAAVLTIAKTWKQPKCPSTEEWIKKMWCNIQWNTTQP